MLMEMFAQQEVVISALCTKTIDMCEFMEGQRAPKDAYDPDAWLTPKKTTPHRHVCDSLTYPMFYYRVGGFSGQLYTAPMSQRIFHCGQKF